MADALIGKEGWLFLKDDTNSVIDQITGQKALSKDQISLWQHTINKRPEYTQQHNIFYRLIIIPNKECVYAEYLPDDIGVSANRPAVQLAQHIDSVQYDLDCFLAYKDVGLLYHKADTHWTRLGCVLYMNDLLNNLTGVHVDYEIYETTILGDLGNKLQSMQYTPTQNIKYRSTTEKIYDNWIAYTGHIMIYKNQKHYLPVGLIFGDSFTNVCVDIIAQYFSLLYIIHALIFDYDIIQTVQPDIIFNMNIERFINLPYQGDYLTAVSAKMLSKDYLTVNVLNLKNDICDRLPNIKMWYDYLDSVKKTTNFEEFLLLRYQYITKNKLLSIALRRFIGVIYSVQQSYNQAKDFATFYYCTNTKIRGIVFYLKNLIANTELTLSIYAYDHQPNTDQIDLKSLSRLYQKKFNHNNCLFYSDEQEVFLDISDLQFALDHSYLFVIHGDHYLGIGQSYKDLLHEEYFLRGYYSFDGQTFVSFANTDSIAYRIIEQTTSIM